MAMGFCIGFNRFIPRLWQQTVSHWKSLSLGANKPKELVFGSGYNREWYSLSPQGRMLAVVGGGREAYTNKAIAIIDLYSGKVSSIPNPGGQVSIDPALSPDGKKIAFIAAKDAGTNGVDFSSVQGQKDWIYSRTLWVENTDGTGKEKLTAAGQGILQPVWLKDGNHIMYVKDNSLWVIGVDGGEPEKLLGPLPGNKDPFGYYGYAFYNDIFSYFASDTEITVLDENEALVKAKRNMGLDDFPDIIGKQRGAIHGGGPYPGIKIQGELETKVDDIGNSTYIVTFIESWNVKDFHYEGQNGPELSHFYKLRVTPDEVKLIEEGGDFPPQLVK
ncbi:MAG: TolB family protein [Bacillota bacterium]